MLAGVGVVVGTALATQLWWTPPFVDHIHFLGEPVLSWSTASGLGSVQFALGLALWVVSSYAASGFARMTLLHFTPHEATGTRGMVRS